ncbi:isochorismatase family protein [Pseudonocardia sp. N23]|uniref:isochorismatase family protein n=1 Tax=Pseudonocardia sp. N23 TaxID=1987376 RepID=UPI000BFDDF65|nr:isochorismatase family protein [Pseudonocardia sp. N23]GAY07548.1 N-carbamoylsarcosine amidase [Pseudonocardia sp. N23]
MSFEAVGDFYAERGIGATAGTGSRPAVLVVDVSRAFTSSAYGVGADDAPAVPHIAGLLGHARAAGLPIVFTTIAYAPGEDGASFAAKVPALRELRTDDPAAVEIHPELGRQPDELVLVKKFPSAFFGTHLTSYLVQRGIDTVVVTGCSTSGCIRASVIDAVSYGFRVVVPEECVFDRAEEPHRANLFDIGSKYADVVPQDEVEKYLASIADGGR